MAELKDDGVRKDFGTGAVRDVSEGKGRCDLLPLYTIGKLLQSEELKLIGEFQDTKNEHCLLACIRKFSFKTNINIYTLIIEVSKHFEDGARKYSPNNWKKGIPIHCYIDSGVRHFLKFLRGDTDEPHDRAFVWNMICAVWTFDNRPDMDDIESFGPMVEDKCDCIICSSKEVDVVTPKQKIPTFEHKICEQCISKDCNNCEGG